MLIKTTTRYHFTLRMAIIKNQKITIGKDMETLEPCALLVEMFYMVQPLKKKGIVVPQEMKYRITM